MSTLASISLKTGGGGRTRPAFAVAVSSGGVTGWPSGRLSPGGKRYTHGPMYRHVPNQLTVLRLILAAVFFLVLGMYRYPLGPRGAILAATAVFIVAAITDWLDGYLARRWNAESTFGRIMDPFCDKVLVIGAFIYLSGPRFVNPDAGPDVSVFNILPGNMASGVYPWMVAIILARELLVTGIRGELEETGVKFGANMFGKLKMIFQSGAVPIILLNVSYDPELEGHHWAAVTRDVIVSATVIVTVLSGIPYVTSAIRAIGDRKT